MAPHLSMNVLLTCTDCQQSYEPTPEDFESGRLGCLDPDCGGVDPGGRADHRRCPMRGRRESPVSRQQAAQLVKLLDAVGYVRITDAEQASLEWLAGFEEQTVANIAAVIRRARDAQ